MRRKVWFHRVGAIVWTLMIYPAFAWWADAVWFVIACSLYANIKSDWGAAEAADDRAVLEAIAEVRQAQKHIVRTQREICDWMWRLEAEWTRQQPDRSPADMGPPPGVNRGAESLGEADHSTGGVQ